MKIEIIDENHFKIVASQQEITSIESGAVHIDGLCIDNRMTYVCSSEPSSIAQDNVIRGNSSTLLNSPIDISNMAFNTDEFLVVYVRLSDITYLVLPCYNNHKLLEYVAETSGIFNQECSCESTLLNNTQIPLYYAFKLSLSILEYKNAMKYWDRLFKNKCITKKCNCNG